MATVYDIETALEYILTAQYGKDVRQAIHDAIHACFAEGGSGSIDLTAREGIQNLTLATEAALAEMNLHSGRTKLIDEQTVAAATETITLPKAFNEFDRLWVHIANIPLNNGADASLPKLQINNYKLPVALPSSTIATTTVDVFFDGITSNTAIVKVINVPTDLSVGGGATSVKNYFIDEYSLPATDESSTALNMSTRVLKLINCATATVSVVGYGMKSTDSGTATGLVRDTDGIVHFV